MTFTASAPREPLGGLRAKVKALTSSARFNKAIYAVIIFNAAILAAETSQGIMAAYGPLLLALDSICLGIFVIELGLRLFAERTKFFSSGWNLFDLTIVVISLMPHVAPGMAVLRSLRIIRVFRLVSGAPSARRVVNALLISLPGMASSALVLGFMLFIVAVMTTTNFQDDFPEWFGSLGASFFTLFQIMTLESWAMGIVRPVMEAHPWAWMLFVPFVVLTTFLVLNLAIGVVVAAMDETMASERMSDGGDPVFEKLIALEHKIEWQEQALRALLDYHQRTGPDEPLETPPGQPAGGRHWTVGERKALAKLAHRLGHLVATGGFLQSRKQETKDILLDAILAALALLTPEPGRDQGQKRDEAARLFLDIDLLEDENFEQSLGRFDDLVTDLTSPDEAVEKKAREEAFMALDALKDRPEAASFLNDLAVLAAMEKGELNAWRGETLATIRKALGYQKGKKDVF